MHPALISDKISKFLTRMTCGLTFLFVSTVICLMGTPLANAKIASRCDEPVFGVASITIDGFKPDQIGSETHRHGEGGGVVCGAIEPVSGTHSIGAALNRFLSSVQV